VAGVRRRAPGDRRPSSSPCSTSFSTACTRPTRQRRRSPDLWWVVRWPASGTDKSPGSWGRESRTLWRRARRVSRILWTRPVTGIEST
jgi:hypothetical protein